MMGHNNPVTTTTEQGGWRIVTHSGREQPWACWHGEHVYFFTDSLFEARRFIEHQLWIRRHR